MAMSETTTVESGQHYHDTVQREFYGNNSTDYIYNSLHPIKEDDNPLIDPLTAFLWLFVVALCYCSKPSVPDARFRRYGPQGQILEEPGVDPLKRKRLIEDSLITKRVIARDDDLNLTLGDVPQEDEGSDTGDTSHVVSEDCSDEDNYDDDAAACVICLDIFRVGDNVTWSRNNNDCLHVFHQDCIFPWLVNPKHDDCPSCRCRIIPQDEEENSDEGSVSDSGDHNYQEEQDHGMAFSIMNGLISRVKRASQRYSLLGDAIDDVVNQLEGDLEEGIPESNHNLVVPMELRRVFSDSPPGERRGSFPRRRRSLMAASSQHQSFVGSSQHSQMSPAGSFRKTVSEHNDRPKVADCENFLVSIPPPLRIRRVRSVDPEVGGMVSDYVIESEEGSQGGDNKLSTPVPLRRISSGKLKRSSSLRLTLSLDNESLTDKRNSAGNLQGSVSLRSVVSLDNEVSSGETAHCSDVLVHGPPSPVVEGEVKLHSSSSIPLRRSLSIDSRPAFPGAIALARTFSGSGGSLGSITKSIPFKRSSSSSAPGLPPRRPSLGDGEERAAPMRRRSSESQRGPSGIPRVPP